MRKFIRMKKTLLIPAFILIGIIIFGFVVNAKREKTNIGRENIAVSKGAHIHTIFDLIELKTLQKHQLHPRNESIVNLYVRNVTDVRNVTINGIETVSNAKEIEWCVATTSNETPQEYHLQMLAPPNRPFNRVYSNPDAKADLRSEDKLKLTSNKLKIIADLKTWGHKDGFCAITREPIDAPVSQIMKLDVWTKKTIVSRKWAWPEYILLAGGDNKPVCEATQSATNEKNQTGVYRCKLGAFRARFT